MATSQGHSPLSYDSPKKISLVGEVILPQSSPVSGADVTGLVVVVGLVCQKKETLNNFCL